MPSKALAQRGWPVTQRLSKQQRADLREFAEACRPTFMVTMMPPSCVEGDAARLRWLSLERSHLADILAALGLTLWGASVAEKTKCVDLHSHGLFAAHGSLSPNVVDRELRKALKQWQRRYTPGCVHVVRIRDLGALLYVEKQRANFGPEIEAARKRRYGKNFWQRGAPFRGQRLSFTKAAKLRLVEFRTQREAVAAE